MMVSCLPIAANSLSRSHLVQAILSDDKAAHMLRKVTRNPLSYHSQLQGYAEVDRSMLREPRASPHLSRRTVAEIPISS